MDPELVALSSTAATTLVALMTTDAWERVKSSFAGLIHRRSPEQAETLTRDLEAARQEVIAGLQSGDDQATQDVLGEWRGRLRRLISEDDEFRAELRRLVEEFHPVADGDGPAARIIMKATASSDGRINQAGRDQTVTTNE